jgi:SAM-dependent methyltransferase
MINNAEFEDNKLLNNKKEEKALIFPHNIEDSFNIEKKLSNSTKTSDKIHHFYNFPKYYDMAFTRDVKSDVSFFGRCFKQYTDLDVRHVLEPACGTGMFLEILPQFGYFALGYDLNPAMVKYSRERINNRGLTFDQADAIVGNMNSVQFNEQFEAAIICINSLGYLRSEEDITAHFTAMGKSIKKEGIYIVELSCMCNDFSNEKKLDDTWYINGKDIELELTWAIKKYDIEHRVRFVDFRMVVNENGRNFIVEEAHELRLWLYNEFKKFAEIGGFEIVGIYNQNYELIPESTQISGELGALFFILKNMKNKE